jgi:hypothetical protein
VKIEDDWLTQLNKLRLEEGKFESAKDATSLKVIRRRIKTVESKLSELDKKTKPSTPTTKEEAPVKKQNWLSKFIFGTPEAQAGKAEKDAWINSYIQQDREAFTNRELDVPPQNKSNPEVFYRKEHKKRTNQWYAQKAEEAYAKEMKIKDPADLAPYIKK